MKARHFQAMIVLVFPALLGFAEVQGAPPSPPCASAPSPAYAPVDAQPNVAALAGKALKGWKPRCGGTTLRPPTLALGLAGTFAREGDTRALLERAGAVSSLKGLRYWSVSDKEWRVLISDASALESEKGARRGDFTAEELASRKNLYFTQTDTRSSGEVVYRMKVVQSSADRLVIETDNVSVVRFLFVPIFQPGDLHTVYFIDRRGPALWGYYALVVANTPRAEGSEDSFINRAVALYRHFIGVADDSLPPLAP